MTAKVVFWHSDDGARIAVLVKQTPAYTYLVMLDEGRGVCKKKVPNEEYTKGGRRVAINLRDALVGGGKPYPLRRARAHYRRMGKTWGITNAAEAALQEMI